MPAALLVALALSGSSLAAPVGQISEFATPTAGSGPEGIVAGPDGNLWAAEFAANRVSDINPTTGAITEFTVPTAGGGPVGVALGPDGNIWFTEFAAGKIGEINPVTHAINDFAIPTANTEPVAIVAGPNGNMWFTESAPPGHIGEINSTTHAVTEFPVMTSGVQPFGIAVGPDGNIWFTEKDTGAANSRIGVMNPATGATSDFPTPTTSSAPNGIATGPNGSLWFTESATNKIGLINTNTDTVSAEIATPTATPLVIVPGPDGDMWFTENGGVGKIGVLNPVTHTVTTEFPTPTPDSGPIGVTLGPDGNLWFTENPTSKIGVAGAGAPPAVVTAATVAGTPQPGQTLTCEAATWSAWAGQQPTFEFGYDGFRWLLNGSQIAGATAQTLAVPAADAGHSISCQEIATYPLVAATVSSASSPVTISPSLGASLVSTTTTPTTVTLTLSCQGLPSQRCTGTAKLTSHVTTRGSKVVAVAAKAKKKPKPKPKPPKKVTKVETIASASYSIPTGKNSTVTLRLNSTGKKALTARYKVPATLTLTGTASARKTVALKYVVLKLSPSYTWAFGKSFSFATELTLIHLPKGSTVALACHGHGCPFAKKTFAAPKNGKLALAPALKKRHLTPHATVTLQITAPREVGEVVIFTIQSGKSPTETFRCLPPGTRAPAACAA